MFTHVRSTTRSLCSILLIVPLLLACGLSFAGYSQPALAASNALPNDLSGTIAYLAAGDTEIRLVEAEGTQDRRLWQVPDPELHKLNGVDWNPNADTLAFTSNHEQSCSLRRADLYTLQPDGSNLQRITNRPACSDLSSYPKGTVTVKVHNLLFDVSLVAVYVQGAPEAKLATVSVGRSVDVTFSDVADFGAGVEQNVVVFAGNTTWIDPTAVADVVVGSTVSAGTFSINSANKADNWGSYSPSWNRFGSRIAFAVGEIGAYDIAVNPGIGDWGSAILTGENSFAGAVAMSPVADEFLYYNYPYIYRANLGENQQKNALVEPDGVFGGMDWLPDGSGFVFAEYSTFLGYGNLWEYHFADQSLTQLTSFESEFAYHPSVSPDGNYIVYAYIRSTEDTAVLKIRTRDGSQVWDLGVEGHAPAWGKQASTPIATPVPPTATPLPGNTPTPVATTDPASLQKVYLPAVVR